MASALITKLNEFEAAIREAKGEFIYAPVDCIADGNQEWSIWQLQRLDRNGLGYYRGQDVFRLIFPDRRSEYYYTLDQARFVRNAHMKENKEKKREIDNGRPE